jgi:ABC-type nitrate/sulfonate/bicarbonate transport system substrate-binding protein
MMKIILASLIILLLHNSTRAADRIGIGVPEFNAQFLPLALAEKRGFFREDGLQGEIIRINPTVALAALVSGELDYRQVNKRRFELV